MCFFSPNIFIVFLICKLFTKIFNDIILVSLFDIILFQFTHYHIFVQLYMHYFILSINRDCGYIFVHYTLNKQSVIQFTLNGKVRI